MIVAASSGRSRRSYHVAAVLILLAEIGIALFLHDDLVSPYLGDSLAVLLVYGTVRGPLGVLASSAVALTTAIAIEFGQLFGLLGALGLEHNGIARLVLGTGFDPKDFVAYAIGGIGAPVMEATMLRRSN